jgi:hypothetical protein
MRHAVHALALLVTLAGAGILIQIYRTSPVPPVLARSTPSPDATTEPTPWTDLQTVVSLSLTHQPTPTKTPRPEQTRKPTSTPIAFCGAPEIPEGAICQWWTPTPTEIPWPTETPLPPIQPCPMTPPVTTLPQYCYSVGGE